MSRDEKVAVVEAFLRCLASKDLARLPVDPDLTVTSPLIPTLRGRGAMKYLKLVSASVSAIQVKQHVVEGDWVATLFDEETAQGRISVFSKFQIVSQRIKDASVFYDPRRTAGSTYHSFAVAGTVLMVFIGLCHEFVGATVFPWGPATFGGSLGWHALGLGGTLLALLLLAGVLGRIALPVVPLSLVFAALGTAISAYTAIAEREFHFFAVSLVIAAIVVAVCHSRSSSSAGPVH
jgi:hypothetical protein